MNNRHDATNQISSISLDFEGNTIPAREGETVATALLAANPGYTGTSPVSGRRRGPYCLMGVCFECLVEIDGVPNQRACLVPVRENMIVRRQNGLRPLDPRGLKK
ncbi:(2Fe-2S)-binding protein (plasmid) [Mesorhizobium sp. AR02]|uniref:(2Fe-2S)-binding protein n=1 Tax=Mesorhizobium sp. AR02 TaxID=2865837 RepID=UPI00215F75A3|nr:(2Fe-2S)-binding protein [Mesorhizobium sp. AR02]UVK49686.1 (2Fe-2S)-binding protein [Mesorhizobium sp. AR02]